MSVVPSRVPPAFRCVLVANRGEIAVRVVRTLKARGVRAVVTASDADLLGLAAREADAVERIGPPPPAASYLCVDAVVAAARRAGADAVHPGYGFLSERHDLAAACEAAGLAFVGPPAAVLAGSSDKLEVKAKVAAAGVPVIPGPLAPVRVEGDGVDAGALARAAQETGYPLLLKAIGGGGGRGLRVVRDAVGLLDAAESARREAAGAFGDARLYLEALLVGARHVEVQILCDAAGRVAVLGDRDCSLQRRHQKVVEEAPAPGLAPATRRALHDAARRAATALAYRNAGTVEFLVDREGRPHFLEVNRRLQVEHPVTEAVLGIDLVAWQLRVAAGEALPEGDGWVPRGHAVEARVCAEDPDRDFLPGSGRLRRVVLPSGPGVRVDAGFATGDEVPPFYDSLLMKVIAHGETRAEALSRLDAALAATTVLGVPTNLAWLRRLVRDDDVRAGRLSTALLDAASSRARAAPEGDAGADVALLAALGAELLGVSPVRTSGARVESATTAFDPWDDLTHFRIGAPPGPVSNVPVESPARPMRGGPHGGEAAPRRVLDPSRSPSAEHARRSERIAGPSREGSSTAPRATMSGKAHHGAWRLDGGTPLPVDVRLEGDRLVGRVGAHGVDVRVAVGAPGEVVLDVVGEGGATRRVVAQVVRDGARWLVAIGGRVVGAAPVEAEAGGGEAAAPGLAEPFATSPMTGVVTKVFVAPGASVARGAPLVAVEAMKMEYAVRADRDVVVASVPVAAGDRVNVGDVVVRFS